MIHPIAVIAIVTTIYLSSVETTQNNFLVHDALGQSSDSNTKQVNDTRMTPVMMESVRVHLKNADKAVMNGNTTLALEQMNLAQMQLSAMSMKIMGKMNESQAMQFMKGSGETSKINTVPDNCIILKDGTLECRDSLTNSYSFITP
jgi:hypothetical protein